MWHRTILSLPFFFFFSFSNQGLMIVRPPHHYLVILCHVPAFLFFPSTYFVSLFGCKMVWAQIFSLTSSPPSACPMGLSAFLIARSFGSPPHRRNHEFCPADLHLLKNFSQPLSSRLGSILVLLLNCPRVFPLVGPFSFPFSFCLPIHV